MSKALKTFENRVCVPVLLPHMRSLKKTLGNRVCVPVFSAIKGSNEIIDMLKDFAIDQIGDGLKKQMNKPEPPAPKTCGG